MSGKVDYNRLINIINLTFLFTSGDGETLSVDDSFVTDFKVIVTSFCIEKVQDGTDVIDEIVNTDNYKSVINVIDGLKNGDIHDSNDAQCNKFANKFVQEVNEKIKNKKWYHQIVIMQCAIIDAIHTIFEKCGGLLTSVDSRIILGLATSFKHWFENSRIQDSDFSKIESSYFSEIKSAVDSFLKKLASTDNYDISSIPENLKNFFIACFGRINDNINEWIKQCNGNVDRYKSDSASKSDVKQSKKTLENIVENISKDSEINNKLIMKLSINLSKIFNVNDIYLIQENVKSFMNNLRKKKQTSKSSDNEKKPHSVELEKDQALEKITSKMQELQNKRKNESSTTEKENFVLKPKIVETNTAQVQSPPASQAKKPESSPEPPKTESVNIDEKIDSITSKIQNYAVTEFIKTFSNTLDRAKLTEQHIGILETFATKLDEKPNILEEEHDKTYQNHLTEFINLVRETLKEKNACSPPSQVHAFFAMTDLGDKLYRNNKIEVNDIKNSAPKLSSYLFGENSDMVLKAVEDVEDVETVETVETVEDANDKARSEELKEQTQNENLRILNNFLDTLADKLGDANCADEACNVLGGCTYIEKDPIEKFINNVTSAPTSIAQYITNLSNMLEKKLGVTGEEEMIKQRLNQIAAARRLNFQKEGNKVKRFAKRAVKKQERQKHTEQKNNNATGLITAIKNIPSTIDEICGVPPTYTRIESILNSKYSSLVNNLKGINFNKYSTKKVTITEIEKIAKQIRRNEDNITSDSIMALAVLYTILNSIGVRKDTAVDSIKQKFKAFAKWFNKYVSPRSAIRSPKVIEALNDKVGTMAGGGDMFKCGKLIRAKNAIKKIAKKDNNSSGDSTGTNSESVSHKEKKRDKFKRHFKKLSSRKLFSRNKKEKANEEA